MSISELSEQEQIRRNSLAELRKLGIEPYPAAKYEVTATAARIAAEYDPDKGNFQEVSIAGRTRPSITRSRSATSATSSASGDSPSLRRPENCRCIAKNSRY